MKKIVYILLFLVLSLSFVGAANPVATFTLQSSVRGVVVHGFLEGVEENYSVGKLFEDLIPEGWEGEGLDPEGEILYSRDLYLDADDIDLFDFGEGTYEDVASYGFLSNSRTGVYVDFTISHFVHKEEPQVIVPWELEVKNNPSYSYNISVSTGKKASGPTAYRILATTNTLDVRWAYLGFDLHFDVDMPIAGDYLSTVVATVIAE